MWEQLVEILGRSGVSGGVLLLVLAVPIGGLWSWVLLRRQGPRREVAKRRLDRLATIAAMSPRGSEKAERALRQRLREARERRIRAAARGRRRRPHYYQ